jgi:peptidoglycan/LPS O-acetylase OafA/YrhL
LQPLFNATLSVNTFYTVTGLLTAYTITSFKCKSRTFKPLVAFVVRMMRLLPPYAAMIGITLLLPLIRSGALWDEIIQQPVVQPCLKSVWPNFLFVNNFYKTREMVSTAFQFDRKQ